MYIDDFLQRYGQTGQVCDDDIFKKAADCVDIISPFYKLKDARKVVQDGGRVHYVIWICGGCNGGFGGVRWSSYMNQLCELFKEFEKRFKSAYLIAIECDCADDVHSVFMGVE